MRSRQRELPSHATPVHMPEPVTKVAYWPALYGQRLANGSIKVVEGGYQCRKVIVSLPKVKGFYE